jgi:hypothetical protein
LEPDLASTEESILAAHFLTCRPINLEAVAHMFRPLWMTEMGFRLKDLGDNIVTIYFQDEIDLERVISSEPWSYGKSFIILQRTEDSFPVSSLSFNSIDL